MTRRTSGDIVRLELKLPAGETWPLITKTELRLCSYTYESGRDVCSLSLNKEQCEDLGFAHYFDGKTTRHLKLNVSVGTTGFREVGDEVPLSKHTHGSSLKEGWVGAALRLILVREAGRKRRRGGEGEVLAD